MLSKNGHNFQHLAPEERLTVAITFRKQTSKSQPEKKRDLLDGGMVGGMGGMGVGEGVGGGHPAEDGTVYGAYFTYVRKN